jgi:GR25 family glycosyltransferase involved in LPS biosynthesis
MIDSWEGLDIEFHVVSMQKSERRRSRMEKALSERRIRHRFVDAVDGDDAAAVRAGFLCDPSLVPRIYKPRNKPISNHELACTLSHMLAIRRAHESGLRQVVICEDDVEFGDVEAGEIAGILAAMPADAAYIQLCASPAATVHGLAKHYIETGHMLAKKRNDHPTLFVENTLAKLACHCAATYIVTEAGMRNVCDRFFDRDLVIFPCHEDEITSNVGLAADQFVYWAAADDLHPGYACCAPTFLLEAVDSLIHPDHVEGHGQARKATELCRTLIRDNRSVEAETRC